MVTIDLIQLGRHTAGMYLVNVEGSYCSVFIFVASVTSKLRSQVRFSGRAKTVIEFSYRNFSVAAWSLEAGGVTPPYISLVASIGI